MKQQEVLVLPDQEVTRPDFTFITVLRSQALAAVANCTMTDTSDEFVQ